MSLPSEITDVFLQKNNVFAMDETTPGVGGDPNRWPQEVITPQDFGIRYVLLAFPGDYTNRGDGNLPDGILAPRQGGSPEQSRFYIAYAPSDTPFSLENDHPSIRADQAVLGEMQFLDFGPYAGEHIVCHGLSFKQIADLRASNNQIVKCLWDDVAGNCIRIRANASNNLIEKCLMQRFPPFATTSDRVGIQLTDGFNYNNTIRFCTIINFTDAIQFTDDEDDIYGKQAGTLITDNFMGVTSECHLPGGGMEEGLENCIDCKIGGAEENPVIIRNNIMFGLRQNSRTGGYCINTKRYAQHFVIENNVFTDNEIGMFLSAQYLNNDPSLSWIKPEVALTGNEFFRIKDNGGGFFPDEAGRVFVGGNVPSVFQNNTIREADYLFERSPNIEAGPWPFDPQKSNRLFDPIDTTGFEWPERRFDVAGNEQIEVPLTNKTVTLGKPL